MTGPTLHTHTEQRRCCICGELAVIGAGVARAEWFCRPCFGVRAEVLDAWVDNRPQVADRKEIA